MKINLTDIDSFDDLDDNEKRLLKNKQKKIDKIQKKLKFNSRDTDKENINNIFGGRKSKRKLTPKDQKFETILKKKLNVKNDD